MKTALTYLTFLDLIFLLLLSLSGFFSEPLSSIVYFLAFIVPLLAFAVVVKTKKCELLPIRVTISRKNLCFTLPLIIPTVGLIMFLSFLTSQILGLFFEAPAVDVSGNILVAVTVHALFPAIFEEALFRYVPIALISPHSRRAAVLVSALLFSLVHCNLFQIPYAFFAGIALAVIDIASDSILPSLIIHFLNNLLSVIYMRYCDSPAFAWMFISGLVLLCIISAVFIIIHRDEYKKRTLIFDGKIKLCPEIWVFVILTMVISITNLIR